MCQTEHTLFSAFVSTSSNLDSRKMNFSARFSWVSEAKGDTVLLTLEAGLLKRLKFQPGDRAEKTSFNLKRKNWLFTDERQSRLHWSVRCKEPKLPTSREPYMINNHWMRWCLRPSSACGHGNTYVTEKGVCLFIRQRIRTDRSGLNNEK